MSLLVVGSVARDTIRTPHGEIEDALGGAAVYFSLAACNFTEVRLVGVDSNRDGLGARVTVHAGGKQYVQVHDGQSGYLSQSRMPLYFGLGSAESVEKIEVIWPTGKRHNES